MLYRLGDILKERGAIVSALAYHEEGLSIYRTLLAKDGQRGLTALFRRGLASLLYRLEAKGIYRYCQSNSCRI